MNPANSSTGAHFNPFLKHAGGQASASTMMQGNTQRSAAPAPYSGGVHPFTPSSSSTIAPPPSTSFYSNAGLATAPPPPVASPFLPHSASAVPPPPMSTISPSTPPPTTSPVDNSAETMESPFGQGYKTTTRNRKGITAAQLYSIHTVDMNQTAQEEPTPSRTASSTAPAAPLPTDKPRNTNDRIDINRIPHPPEDSEFKHVSLSNEADYSASLPPPNYQTVYEDHGNSSYRYMRPTNRIFPHTYYMHKKTRIPCSVFVTPFAEPGPQEEPIPVLDGTHGLVRCQECWAYMNPYCKFTNDGHKFICNLCQSENDVPAWYYSTVDLQGNRHDIQERPELMKGSFEYTVGKEFCPRPPQKPVFAFVIDITKNAHTNGIFNMVLSSIRACIELLNDNKDAKIGICLYDTTTHMLTVRHGHVHEVVMADIDDAYAAMNGSAWLLSPATQADELDTLLSYIETAYNPQVRIPVEHAAALAAIKTVAGALAVCGGHVIVIECTPPMLGMGRISSNESVGFYGTDDESTLYLCSQNEALYSELGTACAMSSICVDFVIACREHVHVAEQQNLSELTGGMVYLCNDIGTPYTNAWLTEIHGYIQNLVLKQHNWDAVLKLRVNNGIKIENVCGHCVQNDDEEVIVPLLDTHSTIEYTFDLPKYLTEEYVYIQLAVLYTTEFGERRIRLFNQKLMTSDSFSGYYKGLDGIAFMMSLTRTASIQTDNTSLPEVQTNLQDTVEEMLLQYRVQCSSSTNASQLVLPENGKYVPLLTNCVLKSPLLIYNEVGKRDLYSIMPRGDLRAMMISYFTYCDASQYMNAIYPCLYKLDPQDTEWGVELDNGFISKPRYLFLTSASLDLSGIYLLSGVRGLLIVVGNHVDSSLLQSLFGVSAIQDSNVAGQLSLLPEGDDFCNRVNVLVNDLQNRYGCYMQPKIILRGSPEAVQVMEMMTEDAMRKSSNFSEYLTSLHSNILSGI